MKKLALVIFAMMLMVIPATVGADTPVKGGGLIICQPAEPPGLDPTANTAAAIDRLVHHSVILELNLPSYRLEHSKENKEV